MRHLFAGALAALVLTAAGAQTAPVLPFQLSLKDVSTPGLPALQSASHAVIATNQGYLALMVGGRIPAADASNLGGLHTFEGAPAHNFPQNTENSALRVIDPVKGRAWAFDTAALGPELSAALTVTNAQAWFDRRADLLYFVGGYGWKADGSDMVTSDALVVLKVTPLVREIQKAKPSASVIKGLIQIVHDPAYKVTGGELIRLGGQFFLIFGQLFDGQYRAFGGADFHQEYTEAIRSFRLQGTKRIGTVTSVSYPSSTIDQDGHPFHRRDGNIVETVDPASGNPQAISLGGVFRPGIIGAYTQPIVIRGDGTYTVNQAFDQKFNQYESPVVTFWSPSSQTVIQALAGGIGHYFLHQSPGHAQVYAQVSQEKRNDGFPFVEDVSFLVQKGDGTIVEAVSPDPLPGERLLGSAAAFLADPRLAAQGLVLDNGVYNLDKFPVGKSVTLGYFYGGIEADNPLPVMPNSGTHGTNALIEVKVTRQPWTVVPASAGTEAVPTGKPHG